MAPFPFFQKIDGSVFLVAGSGEIAKRKSALLQQFTQAVRILSDEELGGRTFSTDDLDGVDYCIASTDDRERNRQIAALCRQKGIPVNVPDDPSLCTFYLPSVVRRGDLVVAVSTGGKSPALAACVRRRIEGFLSEELPEDIEEILEQMGLLRKWLPGQVADGARRRKIYAAVLRELTEGTLPPAEDAVKARALALARV